MWKIRKFRKRREKGLLEIFKSKKIRDSEKIAIIRQISSLIKSGISVPEALTITTESFKNSNVILNQIYNNIILGKNISESFTEKDILISRKWKDFLYTSELSGSLSSAMDAIASDIERVNFIKNKILSASYYPVFISLMALGAVIFILYYVVPIIVPIFEGMKISLPLITKILIFMNKSLINYWYILLLILAFLIVIIIKIKTLIKNTEWFSEKTNKLFIIKDLILSYSLSNYYKIISLMISAGYSLPDSCRYASESCQNLWYKNRLSVITDKLKSGQSFLNSLRELDFISNIDLGIIGVAERIGSIEETLRELSLKHDKNLDIKINKIISIIEPVLLLLVASLIMCMAMAVLLPMYKIMNSIH